MFTYLLVRLPRAQELCESPGGRPGLPSLISQRAVSVDVKIHSTSQPSWDYHDDPLPRWHLSMFLKCLPLSNSQHRLIHPHQSSPSKCLLPAPLTWSHTRRFQRQNTQICYHFEPCDRWHKDCCLLSTYIYVCVCALPEVLILLRL